MPRLIWTPAALADVHRLYRFLAEHDADATRRAAQAIRNGIKILARQPRIGRPVDDMDETYREWLIDFGNSGYAALYRIKDDVIAALAVRHRKEAGY